MTEVWRTTKKLGSSLGDTEGVTHRKQLVFVAFCQMWTLWLRHKIFMKHCTSKCTIVSLYLSSLATRTDSACLESFHHTQLKQLLGIRWPQNISNKALYRRCQCEPLSNKMIEARWEIIWTCTEDTQKHTSTDGN